MKRINKKFHTKYSSKTGLPPGTLKYIGTEKNFEVVIDQILFNEDIFEHNFNIKVDTLKPDLEDAPVRWINITGIHQTELISKIGSIFNIHPLVLEDILHAEQRPKLEDYDQCMYLVLKMINYNQELNVIKSEQVSIVLFKNTVITFQENTDDVFEKLRERIKKGNTKVRKSGADYLTYCLLDNIVDHYFLVLEHLGELLEDVESKLITPNQSIELNELHAFKRELIYLRKSIWPLREVVSFLSKGEFRLIKAETGIYFRDVYDHCVHVLDTLETYRDLTSGLMDLYLSSMSNKMNQVMKTLTIIATIFIPLTFIVGLYGMNFENMPELKYQNGYFVVCGFMLIIALIMLWYFKRKK